LREEFSSFKANIAAAKNNNIQGVVLRNNS
jgi:hypothetical protein